MPRRTIFTRIGLLGGLAAAVVLTVVLWLTVADGDDLPEPPIEGAHVFAGEDGWYFAIEDEPEPYTSPRIWVLVEGVDDELEMKEPPPVTVMFETEFVSPRLQAEVSNYVPLSGTEWYEALYSTDIPEGDLVLTITPVSSARALAVEPVEVSFGGRRDDINFQSWEAESFVFQLMWRPHRPDLSCEASLPYDESKGYWDVTCEWGEHAEKVAVDAETGGLYFYDWSHSIIPY